MSTGPAGALGRFFIDSKLTPLLVVAALALGVLAVVSTPREEEPQIVVPIVDIRVGLPGAGPEEVENRVTVPLEKRMWEIPGVEYVYSVSQSDGALVTVRFKVGDDPHESLVEVWEKMASGLDEMPHGLTLPEVELRTIDDVPVLALTLWSDALGSSELRRIAAELGRELAGVDDVSEIRLIGGEPRRLRVLLDPARLAAAGLDGAAVADRLAAHNAQLPAGSYSAGNREVLVETGGFLRRPEEVARLVVGARGGRPLYLEEVAEVDDGPGEPTSYTLYAHGAAAGGRGERLHPSVTLAVAKRQGADAHTVVGRLSEKVEALRGPLLPPEVEVAVTRDYGATADEKADELLLHLIVAIAAVTVVLGFALGWRGALVVFVAVPVSFALTLFVYYVFGYTLNRVTLFALVFVTGIVVDDSIIVVENMVRHLSRHRGSKLEAAIAAIDEVGNPTILATLTVIAAVLPMAFVRGLMGPYMRPMPVGASLAMTFSLLVALIAAPWFGFRLLRADGGDAGDESGEGEAGDGRPSPPTRTERVYRRLVAPLLDRPPTRWGFLGGVALLLALSLALFPLGAVTVKMLPFDNKSELQVIIDMPEGTTLESTLSVARDVVSAVGGEPEVTNLQIYAGTAAPINFNGLVRHYDLRSAPHMADVQVNFVHKEERSAQSHDLARRIRPLVEEVGRRHGAAIKIAEVPPGPPVLATLVAEVYGPSEAVRREVAGRIQEIFASTDGVVDIDVSVEAPQPKQVLAVDHERAALVGVPASAVARNLRLAVAGETVGRLHLPREVEPVALVLEVPRAESSSPADLAAVRVLSESGAAVPLSTLVTVRETTAPASLHRKNLRPVVYVTAEVAGRRESPVYAIQAMGDRIAALETPAGSGVEQHFVDQPFSEERPAMKWDGEWQITLEVFRDLGIAFGLVLLLIYLLILGWFQSLAVPLVMMIAIPLSLIGILPGHWLFGAFFTATSMIGFIALAGIMVRNSVLLIDFVDIARARGMELREAVLEAGAVRFRPILLTAGTVVVGSLVILFDPIFQGLAISLMTGAFASTVLTLGVVPVVYYVVAKRTGDDGRTGPPDVTSTR